MPAKKKVKTVVRRGGSGGGEKTADRIASYGEAVKGSVATPTRKKNMKKTTSTTKKANATKSSSFGTKKTTRKITVNKKTSQKKAGSASRSKDTKKTVSKNTRKKSKPMQKLSLVHAADDYSFWVNEGPVLRNLMDLHDALDTISDEQFNHHVRDDSDNDFVNWVEDVLCDGQCAISLKSANDKQKAREVIAARLRIYSL